MTKSTKIDLSYTSQCKTDCAKWHGSYLCSLSNTRQCPGSGNMLIQLSHCAIFVHGCYVHKTRSNQSALPIQSHLDDVQYEECNTGKLLHSVSIREYSIGRIRCNKVQYSNPGTVPGDQSLNYAANMALHPHYVTLCNRMGAVPGDQSLNYAMNISTPPTLCHM